MNDVVINGKLTLNPNEEYGKVIVSGKVKCDGNVKMQSLNVNGKNKGVWTIRSR